LPTARFFDAEVDLGARPLRRMPRVDATPIDLGGGAEVASVSVNGDLATITFNRSFVIGEESYNCKPGPITGYHQTSNGDVEVQRGEICDHRKVKTESTPKPATVPKVEAEAIMRGTRIKIDDHPDGERTHVVWVRRGTDLVWVAGFALGSAHRP
jgi:hypothetical protein